VSIISAHDPRTNAPPSQKGRSTEDYPLAAPTTSQDSVNTLDAQSDLATARIADNTESEEDEEENALTDTQLRRLYDDEEIERFLTVFSTVGVFIFFAAMLIYS
jgi:hypothetical protein